MANQMNDEVLETAVCPECGDDAVFTGQLTGNFYGEFYRLFECPCGFVFAEDEI